MMTDPPLEDEEGTAFPSPHGTRILVTALLVALYLAGHLVRLPGLSSDLSPDDPRLSRLTLAALGLAPLFTGFLLVELFSLAVTPGRRLREAGSAGRARLNRAALITSLAVSALQAFGLARFLETSLWPGTEPAVNEPGWAFRLLFVATLTAATAGVFALGNLLSDHGVGNGFALLLLADAGWSSRRVWGTLGRELTAENRPLLFALLGALALVALLVRFVRRTEETATPPFPQGIVPVPLALTGAALAARSSATTHLAGVLLAVPLLSWLAFHLFSSRPRLAANVPETDEVLDALAAVLRRRLVPATALLTAGAAAFLAWKVWRPDSALASFTWSSVVAITLIVLDLLDQFRFTDRHRQTVRLVQLDNLHLSYRLVARLREEGIDALARGQKLRSLSYFFGALFKIDVLVPTGQHDHARQVLIELESAPQVKLF